MNFYKELEEMQTIEEILEFIKKKGADIRKIEESTGIPYDRIYAWKIGRGAPKAEDTQKLIAWAKSLLTNSNNNVKLQNNLTPVTNLYSNETVSVSVEYLSLLKENLEEYKKRINEKEERIQSLLKINGNLKEMVEANLKIVLNNQLAQTCLTETLIKELSLYMRDYDEQRARELRLNLHKDTFQRLKALRQTGNQIEIDNEDIKSVQA